MSTNAIAAPFSWVRQPTSCCRSKLRASRKPFKGVPLMSYAEFAEARAVDLTQPPDVAHLAVDVD